MRHSFLFNITLALIINLLIKPLYIFGIEIPVQNVVGHEAYGMYFTFLNLGFLLQIITDAGLQNHVSTHLPQARGHSRALFSSSMLLKAGLSLMFMLSVGIVGYLLGYWQLDGRLLGIVLMNVVLISMMQHLRAFVSGMGYYLMDTVCSVLDKTLLIVVMGYMLYGQDGEVSIQGFALAQTMTLLVTIAILLFILRDDIGWVRQTWQQLRQHLVEAVPFGVIIALMFLYTRMDAIMIEQLLPDGSYRAGLYAGAYRIYDVVVMLFYLFAPLLLPMMAKLTGRADALKTLYMGSLTINQVAVILVAWVVAVFAPFIIPYLYPDHDQVMDTALQIFMVALVFKAGSFVTSTLLTSQKRFRGMIRLFIVTIGVNFVLNLCFIPVLGIIGAAWATAVTQVWMGIGLLWLCHRAYVRDHYYAYVRGLLMLVFGGVLFYLFHKSNLSFELLALAVVVNAIVLAIWIWVDRSLLAQLLRDIQRQE